MSQLLRTMTCGLPSLRKEEHRRIGVYRAVIYCQRECIASDCNVLVTIAMRSALPDCPARTAIDGHSGGADLLSRWSRLVSRLLSGAGWSQNDCSNQILAQGEMLILKEMPMRGKIHPYLKGIYSSLWDVAKQIHSAGDRPFWKNKFRLNQLYPKWLPHVFQYILLLAIYLSSSVCLSNRNHREQHEVVTYQQMSLWQQNRNK